jgi:hypothetical protein
VSLRFNDRQSGEDLLLVAQAKITNQSYSIPAKGVVIVNFNFSGLIPLEPLDRVAPGANFNFSIATLPTL